MHNLLLSTSKKVIELWKTKNVLTEKHLVEIQKRVDSFTCPSDVGRLPLKISSHFSGFTAEQWKKLDHLLFFVCTERNLTLEPLQLLVAFRKILLDLLLQINICQ